MTEELARYGAPSWLILGCVILTWALSSKPAAKLPGVLGAWSRWITSRQERSIDREMSLREKIDSAVASRVVAEVGPIRKENETLLGEVKDLRKDIAAERQRHRAEVAGERRRHRAELEPIRAERDSLAAWSVFVARWWNDKERALAERGVEVPPPPWPSFQAWLELTGEAMHDRDDAP